MPTKITYLGHSGLLIETGQVSLAVDPFLTGNGLAKHAVEDIQCDYVLITHGHEDHYGPDTWAICKNNDATLIANYEVCLHANGEGVGKIEPGNPGGRVYTPFGHVAFTPAIHSSSYQGQYMGVACGLIIDLGEAGGPVLYHAGDTGFFSDMKLIGEMARPDAAFLPAGDRFTMTPKLAAKAAEVVGAKIAVPIHHSTFPMLTSDLSEFDPIGVEALKLAPGEFFEI